MDVVNMMAMDLLHNKERGDVPPTPTNDERSLTIGLAHSEVNLLSPSSTVSNITSPTFLSNTDSEETIMEHKLVKCQGVVSVGRKRKFGRSGLPRMVEGTRRLRYDCRECKEKGLTKRVSYYCAGCAPPKDCMKYWCCVECFPSHAKTDIRT